MAPDCALNVMLEEAGSVEATRLYISSRNSIGSRRKAEGGVESHSLEDAAPVSFWQFSAMVDAKALGESYALAVPFRRNACIGGPERLLSCMQLQLTLGLRYILHVGSHFLLRQRWHYCLPFAACGPSDRPCSFDWLSKHWRRAFALILTTVSAQPRGLHKFLWFLASEEGSKLRAAPRRK